MKGISDEENSKPISEPDRKTLYTTAEGALGDQSQVKGDCYEPVRKTGHLSWMK